MKLLALIFLMFSTVHSAQVDFQKGYFIDNANNKVECYIKNIDWKFNPTFISYKLDKDAIEKTLLLNQINEFRIYETDLFYKKYNLKDEYVSRIFKKVGVKNRFVLLKILIDAESDLLEYHIEDKYYFFYEKENTLELLEYKEYVDEKNIIRENEKFKKQLFDNFKCDNFTLEDYSKLRYNSTNLSDFFSEYNQCDGGDYINLHSKRTKPKMNLKLRGGINLNSSLTNDNASSYMLSYTTPPFSGNPLGTDIVRSYSGIEDYNHNNSFSFGAELEVRLPFDQNNWSVFIAPNYQNVSEIDGSKSFSEPNIADFEITSSLSYSFVQIPIGFRRYFDVNDKMEIYAHLAYTQNVILSSDSSTQVSDVPTSSRSYNFGARANREKTSNSGGYFGIGLNFLGQYTLDINYYALNLSLNDDYQINMKGIGIIASYTIF